jgi:hypothetical protein
MFRPQFATFQHLFYDSCAASQTSVVFIFRAIYIYRERERVKINNVQVCTNSTANFVKNDVFVSKTVLNNNIITESPE